MHYHFHSKEELLDAVIRRRVEPVNRERLALLDECERAAGDQPPTVEQVLTAFLAPPMRLVHDPAYAVFVRLMGRILAEGDADILRQHFGEAFGRVSGALARALPHLPPQELMLRAHFSMGVMAHALCGRAAIFGVTADVTTDRLVAFISGGLRAPVAAECKEPRMNLRAAVCLLMAAPVLIAQDGVERRGPLRLSMKRAVDLAMSPEGNTNVQLAGEAVKQAQSRSAQARAALLPDLECHRHRRESDPQPGRPGNQRLDSHPPGFNFPTFVGPFNVFDARVSGTQSIFDFSSIRRFQASSVGVKAARSTESGHRRSGGGAGGQSLPRGPARAGRSGNRAGQRRPWPKRCCKQAENQKAAGTGTGIEVTRAAVQLSNDRQRLLVARQRAAAPACNCCAPSVCAWIPTSS